MIYKTCAFLSREFKRAVNKHERVKRNLPLDCALVLSVATARENFESLPERSRILRRFRFRITAAETRVKIQAIRPKEHAVIRRVVSLFFFFRYHVCEDRSKFATHKKVLTKQKNVTVERTKRNHPFGQNRNIRAVFFIAVLNLSRLTFFFFFNSDRRPEVALGLKLFFFL